MSVGLREECIDNSATVPPRVRLIAEAKDERNAEAIIGMAVLRRGMKHSYFTKRPHARLQSTDPSPGEPR